MRRHNLILTTVGTVASTLAGAVTERWLQDDAEAREERNREAFRQRLIRLCKEGYAIKWCRLSPIRDGRRFVEVFHARGVIEFWMDWR